MGPQFLIGCVGEEGNLTPEEPRVRYIGTLFHPRWRVEDPLRFVYRFNGYGGITVDVAAGFETDFASVPRFLWEIYPPQGVYNLGALVHDRLCESSCDRTLADEIFRVILCNLLQRDKDGNAQQGDPLPWWVWWPMYRAVRGYGLAKKWYNLIRRRQQ